MSDLAEVTVPSISTERKLLPPPSFVGEEFEEVGPVALDKTLEIQFVLDSVIEFLEKLKLTGGLLEEAGQLLRDVEAARDSL